MKKLIVLIIALAYFSCNENPVSKKDETNENNGERKILSQEKKDRFKEVAANIAYWEIGALEYEEQPVEIPSSLIDEYYSSLIKFHDNLPPAQQDTIFYMYNISDRITSHTHSISIGVDPDVYWIENWRDTLTYSGNVAIDTILNKYQLKLISIIEFSSSFYAFFHSNKYLNIRKLTKMFKQIDGIVSSDSDVLIGISGHISGTKTGNSIIFSIGLGWGDCPSGCIFSHYWMFEVFQDGKVKLLETGGDPLPQDQYY